MEEVATNRWPLSSGDDQRGVTLADEAPRELYEMKVLLATLLSQVRPSRPAGARSMARRYGIVLGPDDGGRVIVQPTS